ncbi:hypothetical protein HUV48_08850 [Altererythrobacter sp. HHU K3-1]|uniref:Uncharacterized protein n=1 Tax=Qipengyuania atrilutea TaxID=2744473 RepID=A0A850H3J6_9SPHN|nr:hypothetical protein [Actirhodobacter atriluteus]
MKRAVVPLSLFVLGCITGWQANDWLSIDDCLDAGGAWNYERELCDLE